MVHHFPLFANVNSDSTSFFIPNVFKSLLLSVVIGRPNVVFPVLVKETFFVRIFFESSRLRKLVRLYSLDISRRWYLLKSFKCLIFPRLLTENSSLKNHLKFLLRLAVILLVWLGVVFLSSFEAYRVQDYLVSFVHWSQHFWLFDGWRLSLTAKLRKINSFRLRLKVIFSCGNVPLESWSGEGLQIWLLNRLNVGCSDLLWASYLIMKIVRTALHNFWTSLFQVLIQYSLLEHRSSFLHLIVQTEGPTFLFFKVMVLILV